MTSPQVGSIRSRSTRLACAALALLAIPSSTWGATFVLTGDGSSQYLTTLWERCCVYSSCTGSASHPCITDFSVNGRLPFHSTGLSCSQAGGMLDWTASSQTLQVVAMPAVIANAFSSCSWASAWAAVDVRDTPLLFTVIAEPGDPEGMVLRVRPRLVGAVQHETFPGGSSTWILQMAMAVFVDGKLASRDSVFDEELLENGLDTYRILSFPNGESNYATLPIQPGSEVSIRLWCYFRGYPTNLGAVFGTSPYGNGPAIVIDAQVLDVLDVPTPFSSDDLSLRVHPNPVSGATNIRYAIPEDSDVRLSVYDVQGSRVATLAERFATAGPGEMVWNGRDARGALLPSGIYLLELVAGPRRTVAKLVLSRR